MEIGVFARGPVEGSFAVKLVTAGGRSRVSLSDTDQIDIEKGGKEKKVLSCAREGDMGTGVFSGCPE